jgi:hypothetical protein
LADRTHTGTTAVTDIVVVTVPGGRVAPGDSIQIESFWTTSGIGGTKDFSIWVGTNATDLLSKSGTSWDNLNSLVTVHSVADSSQVFVDRLQDNTVYKGTTTQFDTGSIDMTADFDIGFEARVSNAADGIILQNYRVMLLRSR